MGCINKQMHLGMPRSVSRELCLSPWHEYLDQNRIARVEREEHRTISPHFKLHLGWQSWAWASCTHHHDNHQPSFLCSWTLWWWVFVANQSRIIPAKLCSLASPLLKDEKAGGRGERRRGKREYEQIPYRGKERDLLLFPSPSSALHWELHLVSIF